MSFASSLVIQVLDCTQLFNHTVPLNLQTSCWNHHGNTVNCANTTRKKSYCMSWRHSWIPHNLDQIINKSVFFKKLFSGKSLTRTSWCEDSYAWLVFLSHTMFPPLTLHPFPFCETAMELYFWSGWKTQSTSLFRVTTKVFIEGSRLEHMLNCTCNCYTTYLEFFSLHFVVFLGPSACSWIPFHIAFVGKLFL